MARSTRSGAPRGRLARFDFYARFNAAFLHLIWPLWVVWEVTALVVAAIPPARSCCVLRAEDAGDFLVAVLTVVPAVGGLALASYFITALLPNSVGFRAGLRQLYRTRTVFPILSSAGLTVSAAIAAQVATPRGGVVADYLVAAAGLQLGPLLLAVIGVFSRIVLSFDYVSMSRELARDIRASDGAEWGLYEIEVHREVDEVIGSLEINIIVERLNTALNDPLMPIHELIIASQSKELASYVNTLLERAAAEYGIGWRDQGSSPHDWRMDRLRRRKAPPPVFLALLAKQVVIQLSRPPWDIRRMDDLVRRRSRMLMEVLHYLRRLPGNDKIDGVPIDHRRQYVQFELCRFAVLCARAAVDPPPGFGVTAKELQIAHMLSVYAVMEIERDFVSVPRRGTVEPLACLADLAQLAATSGCSAHANWIYQSLAWVITRTDHLRNSYGTHDLNALQEPLREQLLANRPTGQFARSSPSLANPWVRWDEDTGRAPRQSGGRRRPAARLRLRHGRGA